MIEIDTESTLYVCTDGANAEVHILAPRRTTPMEAIAGAAVVVAASGKAIAEAPWGNTLTGRRPARRRDNTTSFSRHLVLREMLEEAK